jgi:branched-chain amino acid transport system permease protein
MGRAFVAVRDNDLAAKTLGINVATTKIWCFFTGSFFAGIGGAVWSFWLGWVEPAQFPLLDSVWYIAYIIVEWVQSQVAFLVRSVSWSPEKLYLGYCPLWTKL